MKELKVYRISTPAVDDPQMVSVALDALDRNVISNTPWSTGVAPAMVDFAMAYSSSHIYLKYYVEEEAVRAVNTLANSAVWEDSCVEFFIRFGGEAYYNLEFNCLGTACVGYGSGRMNRTALSESDIGRIQTKSVITRGLNKKNVCWSLTLMIPFSIFVYSPEAALTAKQCEGNFYKCGDLLPNPHFICWNNVEAAEPDFHLPEYFGKIIFV